MHNYAKTILFILVIMIMMKIGSSFMKNYGLKNQFIRCTSSILYKQQNKFNKVIYNDYHTSKLMMSSTDSNIEILNSNIQIAGDKVRQLKSSKADKSEIDKAVAELLDLKSKLAKLNDINTTTTTTTNNNNNNKSNDKKKNDKVDIAITSEQSFSRTIDYFGVDSNDGKIEYGDYHIIASQNQSGRIFTDAKHLGTDKGPKIGETVWLRGRISNVRAKGNACFIILRTGSFYTTQACHFKGKEFPEESKGLIKYAAGLALESIVDIMGVVASADVKSCSQNNVEIQIKKLFTVSRAPVQLPFLLEDASRSQAEIDASQNDERPFAGVSQDMRLNSRWLDLRVPANNAMMRIRSGISTLFREALLNEGFTEINTPKLIPGESEGGSEVFRTDYFGTPACLAQSPQLYKQMAISADLERVFEIGPVFRAENSNTRRHLCEFTGLDLEMSIIEHYNEALYIIHNMFRTIFDGLESRYAKELQVIREQYPSEPVTFTNKPLIIHWHEAMLMLKEAGQEVDELADLSSSIELKLGELVKEKFDADFYILDQYPSSIRPFYTMPHPTNPLYSNSYDIFIRGQEICSGAQRCHEVDMLIQRIKDKGMDLDPFTSYIDSFRHGVSPHAGAGIGLDRVVFLYLGLDNVRKGSMFPRDPSRISP